MFRVFALLASLVIIESHAAAQVHFALPYTNWEPFRFLGPDEQYNQSVKGTFQSLLEVLPKNPLRRFTLSNIEFIRKFVEEAADTQDKRISDLKSLLESGQLEIVNGAMAEMDSTISANDDMWANWFYGLQYLEKTLDYRPRTAWLMYQQGTTKDALQAIHALGFQDLFLTGVGSDVYNKLVFKNELQLQLVLNKDKTRLLRAHIARDMETPSSISCNVDCDFSNFKDNEFESDYAFTSSLYKYDSFWLVGGMAQWSKPEPRFNFLHQVLHKKDEMKIQIATLNEYANAVFSGSKDIPQDEIDFTVKREGKVSQNGHYNLANHLKQRLRSFGKNFRALKTYLIWMANTKGFDPAVRNSIVDKLGDLGRTAAELSSHDLTRVQADRKFEQQAQVRMGQAQDDLVHLLSFFHHQEPVVCDFRNFDLTGTGCDGYQKLLKKGGYLPFRILNPTLSKVRKLLRIPIPNDANSGRFFLRIGHSTVQSTLVCYRGVANCWLYFVMDLVPLSTVEVTLRAPFSSPPAQGLLTQQAEKVTSDLGKNDIVLQFSTLQVTIRKEGLLIHTNQVPSAQQIISIRKIVTETCNKEFMTYNGTEKDELVGQIRGFSVFRGPVIEGVFVQGDGFTLRLFQQPKSGHYSLDLSVDEDKTKNKCRDLYLSMETPTSADLNLQVDGVTVPAASGVTADALYPVKDVFTVTGIEWGCTVFMEEPRGVIFIGTQLLIGLTRKIGDELNEKFVGKFAVQNWSRRDPTDIVVTAYEEIHRNFDVEFPLIFGGRAQELLVNPQDQEIQVDEGVANRVHLPAGLRLHLEQVAGDAVLIRFNNQSVNLKINLVPSIVIEELFGEGRTAFKVPISTVFTIAKRSPLAKSYELGPSEELAVLVEGFKFITAEK